MGSVTKPVPAYAVNRATVLARPTIGLPGRELRVCFVRSADAAKGVEQRRYVHNMNGSWERTKISGHAPNARSRSITITGNRRGVCAT
jgi:hypothetical protein